jgi:uncharacterized membrane protein
MPTHKRPAHQFLAHQIRMRPRLFISVLVGILVGSILPQSWFTEEITRLLIGWNSGICLYLLLAGTMMARATSDQIRRRAQLEDEGQLLILALVTVAAVASLAAIIAELAAVKNIQGALKYPHIGLAIFTIISSWAFTHMIFALHYAHDYFANVENNRSGGLEFPGKDTPGYGDFLYFAFIIGTSGQTADVSITTNKMRRIGLLHCVLAFLFNTTVLALTINIAAGLL